MQDEQDHYKDNKHDRAVDEHAVDVEHRDVGEDYVSDRIARPFSRVDNGISV